MPEKPVASGKLPSSIGGFEFIAKIGQGGMGTVFKARQISLDRTVALKILPPSLAKDEKFIGRFQREARTSAKLNHPNIVQGISVGKDEPTGLWYFAMEFVDGPTLKHLLETGPLTEERALEIVRDVALGLECAEAQGIVHRDIKPDNILLTKTGEAKLADLGLARQTHDDASMTQSGQAVGTPNYMSPEQVRGRSDEIDHRSDLYALGATLFHLVVGRPPFSGETSAVIMSKHLTDKPPLANRVNTAVSEECSRMIVRLMQKERERRFQSASELSAKINSILDGPGNARPAGQASKRTSNRMTRTAPPNTEETFRPKAAIIGGLALGVIGTVAYFLLRPPPVPQIAQDDSYVGRPELRQAPASATPPRPVAPLVAPIQPPQSPLTAVAAPPEAAPPGPDTTPSLPVIVDLAVQKKSDIPSVPASSVEPAAEAVTAEKQKEAAALARTAYDKFSLEFLELLAAQKRSDAEALLKKTAGDAALKPLAANFARDRKALDWFAASERAISDGAAKLADTDDLELAMGAGQAYHVGKKAEFHYQGFRNGAIEIETKGAGMSCPVNKLSAASRAKLASMGFTEDAAGSLARAFAGIMAVAAGSSASAEGVRTSVEQAKKSGASADDAAYLLDRLALVEKNTHETAAAKLFTAFDKAFVAKNWKPAADMGEKLLRDFADTAAVKNSANLKDRVDTALRKSSPIQEYTFTLQPGQPAPQIGLENYSGAHSSQIYGWPGHADIVQPNGPTLHCDPTFAILIALPLTMAEGGPLPPESEILEAKLHVYKASAYSPFIEVRRVLTPWKEGEITWNSATKSVHWQTPGGDVSEVAANLDFAKNAAKMWDPRWCDFDVTQALRDALKDGKNCGWRINVFGSKDHTPHGNLVDFASCQNPDPTLRPKLELKIRCPRLKNVKE